jgi:hypothetical protein
MVAINVVGVIRLLKSLCYKRYGRGQVKGVLVTSKSWLNWGVWTRKIPENVVYFLCLNSMKYYLNTISPIEMWSAVTLHRFIETEAIFMGVF